MPKAKTAPPKAALSLEAAVAEDATNANVLEELQSAVNAVFAHRIFKNGAAKDPVPDSGVN